MMTGNDVDIDRTLMYSVAHIIRFFTRRRRRGSCRKQRQTISFLRVDSKMSRDTVVSPSGALIKQLGFQQIHTVGSASAATYSRSDEIKPAVSWPGSRWRPKNRSWTTV